MGFLLSLLTSRLGGWVIGALLVALLGFFGKAYINYQADTITELKAEVVAAKRALEIREHDIKVDKEIAHEKEKVDKLTPAELDAEFERLREYGRSRKGAAAP